MYENSKWQTHLPGAMLFPHQDDLITPEYDCSVSPLPLRTFAPTSLDTLQLWTDKFTFPSRWDLPFTILRKEHKPMGALYTDNQGVTVYGSEAHAWLGPVHIRLGRLPHRPALHLTLTLNPGGVLWGSNTRPVFRSDFGRAIEKADAILKDWGIRVQLGLMLPQRLDWRRDYPVQHPIEFYVAFLKSVRPPSCNRGIGYSYETSICYGWQKERVRAYDKPQQIQSELRKVKERKDLTPYEKDAKIQVLKNDYNHLKSQGRNVLRVEHEIRPDASLRRNWGINTLGDLLDNYAIGERMVDEFLSNKILPLLKTGEQYTRSSPGGLITQEGLCVPVEKIESYFTASGAYIYQKSMPHSAFYDELKSVGISRSRLSTIRKKIDEGRPFVHLGSGVTFRQIEEELEVLLFPFGRPPLGKTVKSPKKPI